MKCPDEAQTYSHAYWLYSPNVVKDDNPNLQPGKYLRRHVSLGRERKLLKQYPALPEMIQLTTPHPPDTSSQGLDDTGTIFPPFHPCEAINHYLIDRPRGRTTRQLLSPGRLIIRMTCSRPFCQAVFCQLTTFTVQTKYLDLQQTMSVRSTPMFWHKSTDANGMELYTTLCAVFL